MMSNEPMRFSEAPLWVRGEKSKIESHFNNYFEKKIGDDAKKVWHGQHFEWFANRVERDRFTEVDLAAIGALSVELKAQTARELIEDRDGALRSLLRECELWVATHGGDISDSGLSSGWLEKGSCFNELWYELIKPERVDLGPVKASKLMAAKYPGLIPIRDSQVSWLLGVADNEPWWKPMRELAIEVKSELDDLTLNRDDIHVTALRKLDVVLWMEAKTRNSTAINEEER
jgi:hypothetical protein